MKRIVIIVVSILILIFVVSGGFIVYKKLTTPKKVHYHAGFVMFKDDKKVNFSDFRYMYVKPCNEESGNKSPADIQEEKAHLHDNVGDVVHIEADNAYWKDLFANIHYSINYSNVTAFSNGVKVVDFQDQKIKPYQSIVILIGKNSSNHLDQAVKTDYIEKKAKQSISCGD